MLQSLRIVNVALIDELNIDFTQGLNVMTGETGAGKSIIIDALGFVLGGRADRDLIKAGADTAKVEAVISVSAAAERLKELDAEPDGDGCIMLSRTINSDGRGSSRLNGRTVTSGILKGVSGILIDIHSQHQHQSLLDPAKHITLLDRFCGPELESVLSKLQTACRNYRELRRKMQGIAADSNDFESIMALLTHQLEEIESLNLTSDIEDILLEKRRIFADMETLTDTSKKILAHLQDSPGSIMSRLTSAAALMSDISGYDKQLAAHAQVLESTLADLDDCVREFRAFTQNLPDEESGLDGIEERLAQINSIKRKYKRDVPEIMSLSEEIRQKLEGLHHSELELERLQSEQSILRAEILTLCATASTQRKEAASRISDEVVGTLQDLGMKNAAFSVSVERKNAFDDNGFDGVEFLFSANPAINDEERILRPLAKIASGGEMSRVMLALKSSLASFDSIETFIFDEIDTGISGRTAQLVAEKMMELGKTHQIICVTHLPQIAAVGDANFLIHKETVDGAARTEVTLLDETSVVEELARLIGGAKITEQTLAAAAEMRKNEFNM
ncbi:MAG: DNA repair protein RecN [Defluviitaleaceae bacterium]|nr:DNA repair protein RecN [Defluviitaleaceae bacterium]